LHLNTSKGKSGIDPLSYNSNGFIYDEMVTNIGHLTFYLIFEVNKYNDTKYNPTPSNIVNFSFNLAYKDNNDNYTLLDTYLSSCNYTLYENKYTSIKNSEIYSSNINNIVTSDNLDISNNNSINYYLTLDYVFDVKDNFESILSNELVNIPTFVLTIEVKGN